MKITLHEFVQDVMCQLRPFLQDGQTVHFEISAGNWPLDDEGITSCVHAGVGEDKIRFTVTMNEAILPTQETLHEISFPE